MYQPSHPKLYAQWVTHDLAKYRHSFYERLEEPDQQRVWEYIESNYLSKYQRFISVAFEWGAEGMWRIPFPGSVDMGVCLYPRDFGLPESVLAELRAWHQERDMGSKPWEPVDPFDYGASDIQGLAVAKKIKAALGANDYVEFNAFRELRTTETGVVELEVPVFIRSLCKEVKT